MADEQNCPVIETDNVHKRFVMGDNVVHALKGISMKVEQGEYILPFSAFREAVKVH